MEMDSLANGLPTYLKKNFDNQPDPYSHGRKTHTQRTPVYGNAQNTNKPITRITPNAI